MKKVDREEIEKELEEVKKLLVRLPETKRERAKGYIEGLMANQAS